MSLHLVPLFFRTLNHSRRSQNNLTPPPNKRTLHKQTLASWIVFIQRRSLPLKVVHANPPRKHMARAGRGSLHRLPWQLSGSFLADLTEVFTAAAAHTADQPLTPVFCAFRPSFRAGGFRGPFPAFGGPPAAPPGASNARWKLYAAALS